MSSNIAEKDIIQGLSDFKSIKEYMAFTTKKLASYDKTLLEGFQLMSAKEEGMRNVFDKMMKEIVSKASKEDIISKELIPEVMRLITKVVKDNESMNKRLDSLEHQIKKFKG